MICFSVHFTRRRNFNKKVKVEWPPLKSLLIATFICMRTNISLCQILFDILASYFCRFFCLVFFSHLLLSDKNIGFRSTLKLKNILTEHIFWTEADFLYWLFSLANFEQLALPKFNFNFCYALKHIHMRENSGKNKCWNRGRLILLLRKVSYIKYKGTWK